MLIVIIAWRLAAGYAAVSQAFGLGVLKSTVTLLAVVVTTGILFGVLASSGLSS